MRKEQVECYIGKKKWNTYVTLNDNSYEKPIFSQVKPSYFLNLHCFYDIETQCLLSQTNRQRDIQQQEQSHKDITWNIKMKASIEEDRK